MTIKNVLCVGGLGYLGSTISGKLKKNGNKVDILDCGMYDNLDVVDEIRPDNLFQESTYSFVLDVKDYDLIIWCSDIDVPEYYDQGYEYDDPFFDLCLKQAKNFYYVGHYIDMIEDSPYKTFRNFIINKRNKIINGGKYYIRCGELFGPSPRMRWDTLVNRMIFMAITQKQIFLEGDWLSKYPICNVSDAAEAIIENTTDASVEFNTFSSIMSMVEIAHIIGNCFEDFEKVNTVGDCDKILDLNFEPDIKDNFSIESSIKQIIRELEAGHLPDFMNDTYSNEVIVNNMINGRLAWSRLRE